MPRRLTTGPQRFSGADPAGLVDRPLTHTEVLEEGEKAAARLADLIGLLVARVF